MSVPKEEIDQLVLELRRTYGVDPESAAARASVIVERSREIGYDRGLLVGLKYLGNANRMRGLYRLAQDQLEESAAIAQRIGDTDEEAAALMFLGSVYIDLAREQDALTALERAAMLYEGSNSKEGHATALLTISNVYLVAEDAENALKYARRALALFSADSSEKGIALAFANLGIGHSLLKEYDRAIEYTLQARSYFVEMRMVYNTVTLECNLGDFYNGKNDPEEALRHYDAALYWLEGKTFPYLVVGVHCGRAVSSALLGNTTDALASLAAARQIADALNSVSLGRDCDKCDARLHQILGEAVESPRS